jgi:hypothetical protein
MSRLKLKICHADLKPFTIIPYATWKPFFLHLHIARQELKTCVINSINTRKVTSATLFYNLKPLENWEARMVF